MLISVPESYNPRKDDNEFISIDESRTTTLLIIVDIHSSNLTL